MILSALSANAAGIILDNPLKYGTISEIIGAIGDLIQVLALAIGVIMIIIAGIQYMTSAGSEEKTGKAKKTILYTLIGVAIVISVNFIIGLVTEILGKK